MPESPRILVVEDDPSIAKLFAELLPARGWSTLTSANAEKALAILAEQPQDLVIVDKNLPGMSGLDLLARIKADTPDTEVIMMTAYADMKSVLKAMGSGVYDYLVKPFESLDDVTHTVARALDHQRTRRENRTLVKQLEETNQRLRSLNEGLEATVAERTQQLEELSLTDDVTGLYNQRFLHRRLAEEHHRAIRYQRALSVLMLDIDHFKEVNDTHDHLFGSRVLRRVGQLLRKTIRDVEVLIRYGGDEFVILLPETTTAGAAVMAERMRQEVASTDVGEANQPYRVTISTGIATLHESTAENAEGLLQAADRALYAAKHHGRDCVFCMVGDTPQLATV